MYLTQIVAFGQDTVTPCRDASFVAAVVFICTDVVFVCRQKSDSGLIVVWERLAMDHLEIELYLVSTKMLDQTKTQLTWSFS